MDQQRADDFLLHFLEDLYLQFAFIRELLVSHVQFLLKLVDFLHILFLDLDFVCIFILVSFQELFVNCLSYFELIFVLFSSFFGLLVILLFPDFGLFLILSLPPSPLGFVHLLPLSGLLLIFLAAFLPQLVISLLSELFVLLLSHISEFLLFRVNQHSSRKLFLDGILDLFLVVLDPFQLPLLTPLLFFPLLIL